MTAALGWTYTRRRSSRASCARRQVAFPERLVRTFGTMTVELEQLRDWLIECGCSHVAMEATGVYWKPVYNLLEERGDLQLLVFDSQHLTGRKTDVKDAEWIATLLRHGLVRTSFIPDRGQRELREFDPLSNRIDP